jgi:hypothetical protein
MTMDKKNCVLILKRINVSLERDVGKNIVTVQIDHKILLSLATHAKKTLQALII